MGLGNNNQQLLPQKILGNGSELRTNLGNAAFLTRLHAADTTVDSATCTANEISSAATMQAWSGNISTDDSATCIPDVQIWVPNASAQVPLPQAAKLHFLSIVEVARIPLYLAAGPSYNVFTENECTTRWLTEALLDSEESDLHGDASREPWWLRLGGQSENGILLRVDTQDEEGHRIQSLITEVLLYAAVANTSTALPSPVSSFPAPPDEAFEDNVNGGGNTIKVYALPLCSSTISTEVCLPPAELESAGEACFLPHTHNPLRLSPPAPQKRQSISTLLEDATKKRRKFKGRGGESISQAMAGIDCLPSQHGMLEKQEAPQPRQNDLRRKSLSRTSSMAPVASIEHPRPTSRSGPMAHGKRSSLHRVESAVSPRDSPTPSDAGGSYVQQNKAALTKVVMAAMRLYGLQQKKKPLSKSRLPSQVTVHTETNVIGSEAEDEYKLVYHQTFKAATFTFRKHLNALLISQETMRDVVDRLLTMFCTDPMIVDRIPDSNDFPDLEAKYGLPSSSPFDKPSAQARYSKVANVWNTPTAKKR